MRTRGYLKIKLGMDQVMPLEFETLLFVYSLSMKTITIHLYTKCTKYENKRGKA